MNIAFLTGNALKILAALFMLLDHAGILLFPGNRLLRILGRLAMPIFAFMIAEGCKYTRSKGRYWGLVFGLGAVCQAVYYFFDGSTYLSILITFSLSIGAIFALQLWKSRPGVLTGALFFCAVALIYVLNDLLTIDYGFWGCMVPVFAAVFHNTRYDRPLVHVGMLGLGLIPLAAFYGGIQWYSLLALPLLALYSGKRGKWKLKYFFYIFYPAHLVILQGIAMLLQILN